jgi:hypothetical protein
VLLSLQQRGNSVYLTRLEVFVSQQIKEIVRTDRSGFAESLCTKAFPLSLRISHERGRDHVRRRENISMISLAHKGGYS